MLTFTHPLCFSFNLLTMQSLGITCFGVPQGCLSHTISDASNKKKKRKNHKSVDYLKHFHIYYSNFFLQSLVSLPLLWECLE